MKFLKIAPFWVTDFGWPDISFGLHICLAGRIDIHFAKWMLSIGKVPIYKMGDKTLAVSNSYHSGRTKNPRGNASGSL